MSKTVLKATLDIGGQADCQIFFFHLLNLKKTDTGDVEEKEIKSYLILWPLGCLRRMGHCL